MSLSLSVTSTLSPPPISHGSQNVFSLRLIRLCIFGVGARVFNRSIATGPLLRCILNNLIHAATRNGKILPPTTRHSESCSCSLKDQSHH